jgi:hypothetical protein
MGAAPAGISDADWLLWPAEAREFILEQQRELWAQKEDIERLHSQITDLAMQLADLSERIGHSSRKTLPGRPPATALSTAARKPQRGPQEAIAFAMDG